MWRSIKKITKNKCKALQNNRDGPYVILNRFAETTYEVKHLYKPRAKRETVHRDRLTRCHMRKLNLENANEPFIKTYHSQSTAPIKNEASATQPQASRQQLSTTTPVTRRPVGRPPGSRNKQKTAAQPSDYQPGENIRKPARIQEKN